MAPAKKQVVANLVRRLEAAPVVAIVKIHGIPAPQIQAMRSKLRGTADLTVAKNSLLRIALKEAAAKRGGIESLAEVIEGPTAVATATVNPFQLFRHLESTKAPAPARGGEVAPQDIWVREGETPFKPGPIVGELQKAGIPAAIERGKVVVKKDLLLVKAGDRIPREIAAVLARLDIFPLIVGLDLRGVYEAGTVFRREVLAIDTGEVIANLARAAGHAFALSMAAAIPNRRTVGPLFALAHRRALSLAVHAELPVPEGLRILLAKAYRQMLALAARAPEIADAELQARMAGIAKRDNLERPAAPKKEEKGPSDEDAAAGLGALFG